MPDFQLLTSIKLCPEIDLSIWGACYNRGLVLVILAAGNRLNLITTASLLYRGTNTLISIV